MKAKLLILMILVMFISSCGAHKTPQSEKKILLQGNCLL